RPYRLRLKRTEPLPIAGVYQLAELLCLPTPMRIVLELRGVFSVISMGEYNGSSCSICSQAEPGQRPRRNNRTSEGERRALAQTWWQTSSGPSPSVKPEITSSQ